MKPGRCRARANKGTRQESYVGGGGGLRGKWGVTRFWRARMVYAEKIVKAQDVKVAKGEVVARDLWVDVGGEVRGGEREEGRKARGIEASS